MLFKNLTKEEIAKGEFHCHRIVKRTFSFESKFQRIDVLEAEGYGRGLFLDGRIQHVEGDEYIYSEAMVHPPMFFLGKKCHRVLCIGGGPGGIIRELVKYPSIEEIIQVDIDEDVISVAKKYFSHISQGCWEDKRVELVIDNAIDFLKVERPLFDLIINDVSEPILGGPATELFTMEGLSRIKSCLSINGIYVTWAGSGGPKSIHYASSITNAVKHVFPYSCSYLIHPQSYGTSWLTTIGSMFEILPLEKTPKEIDDYISDCLNGELRLYDGLTHYHIFSLPKDVRRFLMENQNSVILEKEPFYLNVETQW